MRLPSDWTVSPLATVTTSITLGRIAAASEALILRSESTIGAKGASPWPARVNVTK
jgi:hypothetical protein